jgi:predicted O-methyltransferase YrrM
MRCPSRSAEKGWKHAHIRQFGTMEMNEVLQAILASKKVTTDSGIERLLDYHIDSAEGEFVQSLIRKHRPQVILEVGCAYGISSLYIGEALRERRTEGGSGFAGCPLRLQ